MERTDKSTLAQFQGSRGRPLLVDTLRSQALIRDQDVALEFARHVSLEYVFQDTTLIHQDDSGSDLFLILTGEFSILVNGKTIEQRPAGEYLGEMALVDPDAPRSASVIAACDSVVARITEPEFSKLAERFPRLWRRIASGLAAHLRGGKVATSVHEQHFRN